MNVTFGSSPIQRHLHDLADESVLQADGAHPVNGREYDCKACGKGLIMFGVMVEVHPKCVNCGGEMHSVHTAVPRTRAAKDAAYSDMFAFIKGKQVGSRGVSFNVRR